MAGKKQRPEISWPLDDIEGPFLRLRYGGCEIARYSHETGIWITQFQTPASELTHYIRRGSLYTTAEQEIIRPDLLSAQMLHEQLRPLLRQLQSERIANQQPWRGDK